MSMTHGRLENHFSELCEKLVSSGAGENAIRAFRNNYEKLLSGESGQISDQEIEPIEEIAHYSELSKYTAHGKDCFSRVAILKLNGGLGTSMGLERAKSLIAAHAGLSFLDIVVAQTRYLRKKWGVSLPLLFMNSFYTDQDTRAALASCSDFDQGPIPLYFMQNQVPKVLQQNLAPVSWPQNPALEWCPPGHGDLYTVLQEIQLLEKFVEQGIDYLFVSNSDNLGAVLDPALLGFMDRENLPFLMEVASRTEADRKGGHLARRRGAQGLILREAAQCPEDQLESFQDIKKYSYFNTNSIWISLQALKQVLDASAGVLDLPLIRNQKHLDPNNANSPLVYQLENAMGAAVALFPEARAVCVPRDRFAPVKTTDDLLALRSDAYQLSESFQLQPAQRRKSQNLFVRLDTKFYRSLSDFDQRFAQGVPSLVQCERFEVQGDIRFGSNISCRGSVMLRNLTASQITIPDGALLSGEEVFD